MTKADSKLDKRAVRLLDATIGIHSNNGELIRDTRYFESKCVESLRTNVYGYEEVPFETVNADFYVIDEPQIKPFISIEENVCRASGDFTAWEKECSDIRYSLFGNLGLFFRYSLSVLERYHGIYSFHASSIFIPNSNTLLLIIGGPGAGKTVYLLKALLKDWKIFSTEMTHFRLTEHGVEFFKGSLYDNVRLGSLVYDFPEVIDKLKLSIPKIDNPWEEQIAIDLNPFQADDVYQNPKIQIVNARIESNRDSAYVSVIENQDKIISILFKNAGEKFNAPWLMYERLPVPGCDDETLAKSRLEAIHGFLERTDLLPMKSILAGVKNCMEGI